MKRYETKKSNYMRYAAAGIFSGAGCIIMVAFPQMSLEAARRGVTLWSESILPSLLPFFICANFMIAMDIPQLVGRYFEGLFRFLFRTPGSSAFVFIISITSGYPMGPKLIGDMGRKGEITLNEAKRMLAFCSTSGPLFMLGTVGAAMLGSAQAGVLITVAHYGGAVLNGVLFRLLSPDERQRLSKASAASHNRQTEKSLLELFTESILGAFRSLGVILGYVVLFTLITEFTQFFGLLNFLEQDWAKALAKGLMEMTVGASSVAASSASFTLKCVLCAFLVSFGGLSIMAQSKSMLSGLDISTGYYLLAKLGHGIFAAWCTWLLAPWLLSAEPLAAGTFNSAINDTGMGSLYGLLFSGKMVIMVLCLFLLTVFLDWMLPTRKKEKNIEHSGNHS